jgi:hypothetical protein
MIFHIIDMSYAVYSNVHGKVTKCLLRRGRMYIGYINIIVRVFVKFINGECLFCM